MNQRVFVPTRVTPAGLRHLAVNRGGRSRVVAFENFDMAQRAVDVLSGGDDLIHVVAELLSQPLRAGHAGSASEGVMVVHETYPYAFEGFQGVDLCEFQEPNFVDVVDTMDRDESTSDERARLDGLFDRS